MAVNGVGTGVPGLNAGQSLRAPKKQAPPQSSSPPSGESGGSGASGGAKKEDSEYPQGVTGMLNEVHGLLQKQGGKGLPGFSVSGPPSGSSGGQGLQA